MANAGNKVFKAQMVSRGPAITKNRIKATNAIIFVESFMLGSVEC
jgi:hypothetical protein